MPTLGTYQADTPLEREAARDRAMRWIRMKLGQSPYVSSLESDDDVWRVSVSVRHPKVMFNEATGTPRHPVFYQFNDIAELQINRLTGEIEEAPDFYTVQGRIQEGIEEIHTSVERALTKAAAGPFSRLPFGEHFHTPLLDIFSWLLFNEYLDLSPDSLDDLFEEPSKAERYIELLADLDLVRYQTEETVEPDNDLVEIFGSSSAADHEKVQKALSVFFARGFEDVDSVRQVLGPYLRLSRIIFEDSLELGEVTPVPYGAVHARMTSDYQGKKKKFKIPRYLVQMEEIGIIEVTSSADQKAFRPAEKWFKAVSEEQTLLDPLKKHVATPNPA